MPDAATELERASADIALTRDAREILDLAADLCPLDESRTDALRPPPPPADREPECAAGSGAGSARPGAARQGSPPQTVAIPARRARRQPVLPGDRGRDRGLRRFALDQRRAPVRPGIDPGLRAGWMDHFLVRPRVRACVRRVPGR